MKLTNDGHIYFPDQNGHFVSEKQRIIAGIIQDYDPNLQLQWIPNGERGPDDYAFRVVDTNPRSASYVVCFAHECDERLLARVFQADQTKHNAQSYLDAHNAAVEAYNLKKDMEQRQEDHDLAFHVYRSKKIHYRHGGIDFGKPFGGRFG